MTPLTVLYRGLLTSCNYACGYCPFAKRHESRQEHEADRQALARFVAWCRDYGKSLRILFTPWGEALVRRRYRESVVELSWLPFVEKVAIQTNLSVSLEWLGASRPGVVALWTTYHPSETSRDRFLAQCHRLHELGVRHSVGMVATPGVFEEIAAMREALPETTYLWVNARKHLRFSAADIENLRGIDPFFPLNVRPVPSRGRVCSTGETVISVSGDGTIRRCHFVPSVLGNLYDGELEPLLAPRPCPKSSCECHIGYVHMPDLRLGEIFGDGLLERIPENWPRSAAGP